jgi:predicted Ser/Thr protein kinase
VIEPTDEMVQVAEEAAHDHGVFLHDHQSKAILTAVLALVERDLRAAIAEDIRKALAADEADSDVTSGEAIWEQTGYRRGLADAAEITATPPQ